MKLPKARAAKRRRMAVLLLAIIGLGSVARVASVPMTNAVRMLFKVW